MMTDLVQTALESINMYYAAWCLLVWGIILYGYRPLARWKYRHIPGPPYRFLLGGLPEIGKMGMETACSAWASKYGDRGVYKVFYGGIPHVVCCNAETCNQVLRLAQKYEYPILSNPDQGPGTNKKKESESDRHMQNNLVYASGKEWQDMRRVWNPEFKTEKLRGHFPVMEKGVQKMVDCIESIPDNTAIDIYGIAGNLSMDVITAASFGVHSNSFGNADPGLSLADKLAWAFRTDMESADVLDIGMALLYLFPSLWPIIDFFARKFPSKAQLKAMQARELVEDVFATLIRGIRSENPNDNIVDPSSFLNAMAQVKDENGSFKDEVWTLMQSALFVSTGYDTSSGALAFTIYLLAANPDKQAKLLAEIDSVSDDFEPTFENIQTSLPYLNGVLQESLRLLPPAPFTIRQAKDDMTIGSYFIPKGTWLKASMYTMHRSPDHWENPLRFVPERFVEGTAEFAGSNPKAFAPFGGGSRRCPGYLFAQIEVKLALYRLYQKYRFRLCHGDDGVLKTKTLVTLTPLHGVKVIKEVRQK